MIDEITHLGGLPGLPGRVTLSARVAFWHVNVARWGNPPSRARTAALPEQLTAFGGGFASIKKTKKKTALKCCSESS